MGTIAIFTLAVVVLLALLVLEVPVGVSLIGASLLGITLARSSDVAMATLGQLPFNATSTYSLAVVPLYVLTGALATKAGIASDLFSVAKFVFQKVAGGLGAAAIAGCAGFAAVTGSSVATVASVGRTAVMEMRSNGYDPKFAAGIVASAGTLGILIPPSVILVLFGITTGTSIGALLIAGIVPGILSAIVLGVAVTFLARRNPKLVGDTGQGAERIPPPTAEQYVSLGKVAVLFVVIVGGVYGGWYTATEAGAFGAAVALVMLFMKRGGESKVKLAVDSLVDSARLTSGLFVIVVGGALFTYLIVSLRIPQDFAAWTVDLPVSGAVVITIILLMMIPLGMVLDSISIVLVFVPIVFPIVAELGYDMVWFAILAVKLIEIGLITPPVGMNAFVIAGSVPDISAETVFRGVVPFIVVDTLLVVAMFLVPEIVTFLPNQMR